MNIHQDGLNLEKMSVHVGVSKLGTGPRVKCSSSKIENDPVYLANLYKIDLEKAVELLNQSLYFINQVPNKKYKTSTGESSYELASKINKFLTSL